MIIKKDNLPLGEGPTQELGSTTITAEAKYPINFARLGRRFVLNLYYNGSNSFLFINVMKMAWKLKCHENQFRSKDLKQILNHT